MTSSRDSPQPDPDFPMLVFVPPSVRDQWSETEKHKRHCEEIAAAHDIWMAHERTGMTPFEAAVDLPVPYMNRPKPAQWLGPHGTDATATNERLARELQAPLRPENVCKTAR
jgi:hypothetical protein